MTDMQLQALTLRNTDIDGAKRRFYDDEKLYIECLMAFMKDSTMQELNEAIEKRAWDDAFTAAHALKGVAGNMGFVPLMHIVGQLVVLIRGGRLMEIDDCLMQVKSSYMDITDAISTHFIKSLEAEGRNE